MAAHAVLKDQAKVGDATNNIFWLDPWSKDGQKIAAQVRPYTHDLRMHAEAALTLIAQARAAAGPNPAGAQIAPPTSARPQPSTTPPNTAPPPAPCASPTPSTPWSSARAAWTSSASNSSSPTRWPQATRAPSPTPPAPTARPAPASTANSATSTASTAASQDIRNGYTLIRDLYESAWLRSNRPYWLRNILEQYDYTTQIWLARADKLHSAQRQWADPKTLPTADELGIPQRHRPLLPHQQPPASPVTAP